MTFEQAAGFLRVVGTNPLDRTNIHPEDYELVNMILNDYGIDLNLLGTELMEERLKTISDKDIQNKFNISCEKWLMIKENLVKGIIDPREDIKQMTLRSDVLSLDDLEIGMELEGTVRNVTSFGAFVDIGLHDDGLVHISKMSRDFIKHPSEVLKIGDIITVYVCDIDKNKERVSLSLIKE